MYVDTQDSLVTIYREHHAFVWSVLRRFGVDGRDLEDVVQDVFLVVHRRLGDFEGRASIKTWLYAIAVRVALNHTRRRRRRPAMAETSCSSLPALDRNTDPEEQAARAEASDLLNDLLGKLDPDKRVVFVLAEIEGLPAHEIARIVGAKTRTVYSRLRAARERFATDLQRTRARDRRWRARELIRRAQHEDRPPPQSRDRTWAALALRLGDGAAPIGSASLGLPVLAKAALVSMGIAAAGLTVVVGVTSVVRPADDRAHLEGPVSADAPQASGLLDSAAPLTVEAATPSQESRDESAVREVPSTHPTLTPRPPRTPAGGATLSVDEPLAAELELMRRARAALAADEPETALDLLDRHAREHALGALAPDRKRTRITVLCRLGRTAEAREEAGDPRLRCSD